MITALAWRRVFAVFRGRCHVCCENRGVVLWLLLLSYSQKSVTAEPDRKTVTVCTGHTLTIACDDESRVLIDDAWYGWSSAATSGGECNPDSRDMNIEIVPTNLMNTCTGQRKCSLTVDAVSRKNCLSNRHCISSYQMVKYRCVKDKYSIGMCKDISLERDLSFLSSPQFPNNIPGTNFHCTCTIHSAYYFDITLVYQSFSNEKSENCKQQLQIDGKYWRTTWDCDAPMGSKVLRKKTALLELRSDLVGQDAGRFWIQFSGKYINIQCSPQNHTQNTTTALTSTTEVTKLTTPDTSDEDDDHVTTYGPLTTGNEARTTQRPMTRQISTQTTYHGKSYPEPWPNKSNGGLSTVTISALIGGFIGGILLTASIFIGIICLVRRKRTDTSEKPIVNRQDSSSTLSGYTGLINPASIRSAPPNVSMPIYAILRPREEGRDGEGDLYEVIPYDYAYSPSNRTSNAVPPPTMPRSNSNNPVVNSTTETDVDQNGYLEMIDNNSPTTPSPSRTTNNAVENTNTGNGVGQHGYLDLIEAAHLYRPLPHEHGYLRPVPSLGNDASLLPLNRGDLQNNA